MNREADSKDEMMRMKMSDQLSLYHNCDSIRYDYDEKLTRSFFARLESRRIVEWKQARNTS